jgi:hypothetical protein
MSLLRKIQTKSETHGFQILCQISYRLPKAEKPHNPRMNSVKSVCNVQCKDIENAKD